MKERNYDHLEDCDGSRPKYLHTDLYYLLELITKNKLMEVALTYSISLATFYLKILLLECVIPLK